MQWIADHAALLALIGLVLASAANHITAHWTRLAGVGRVLAWVSEALSILTSKGAINGPWGALKLPLQTIRPADTSGTSDTSDTPTDPQRRIGGEP